MSNNVCKLTFVRGRHQSQRDAVGLKKKNNNNLQVAIGNKNRKKTRSKVSKIAAGLEYYYNSNSSRNEL